MGMATLAFGILTRRSVSSSYYYGWAMKRVAEISAVSIHFLRRSVRVLFTYDLTPLALNNNVAWDLLLKALLVIFFFMYRTLGIILIFRRVRELIRRLKLF